MVVALRVVLGPLPQVIAGVLESQLRLPAQLLVCECGVGSQVQDIAGAPLDDLVSKVAANGVAESLDHVEHGGAPAGAQVPRLDARVVLTEVVQGNEVTLGQVQNVNVVANGRAVLGGVV